MTAAAAARADLLDRAREFLAECASCDCALEGFGCTCPPGDPRLVIAELVTEVEHLRAAVTS